MVKLESDATVVNDDKKAVAEAITAEAVKTAGYDSLDAAKEDGVAFVFMGHGTSHTAKVSYSQMQSQMGELGYENVFIGTVEGEPEETACENVIQGSCRCRLHQSNSSSADGSSRRSCKQRYGRR